MATAAPKAARSGDKTAEATPPSKKKLIVIALAAVLLGAGGAGAWFFLGQKPAQAEAPKAAPPATPVFVVLDTFTVNLQGDEEEDHYLQTQFTLQVGDTAQADLVKLFMPQVRSRLLTLLSSKKAADLKTPEGKQKLSQEIMAQVRQPFAPNSAPQQVSDVFFTSFVIQ